MEYIGVNRRELMHLIVGLHLLEEETRTDIAQDHDRPEAVAQRELAEIDTLVQRLRCHPILGAL